MVRANRHFIPGHIRHLTRRRHKREFLLKFSRDRNRWIELLFKARDRYQLSNLNFIVTSNHIHLIVFDSTRTEAIPRTMQFVAGRLGQEYNRRKNRKGAFGEDCYPATAIESGDHLWRCIESQLEKRPARQEHFSKNLAVGSKLLFVEHVRRQLKTQALGRRMVELPVEGKGCRLKKVVAEYGNTRSEQTDFDGQTFPITTALP